MKVKYPDVTVKLIGQDGNAFNLLGIMQRELRRAGIDEEEVKSFMGEAMSGDYNNLLATCQRWVNVE